ncbi:acyl-CoA reductase [Pelobium sp.]|nr:acyl-CoA reductase [Pelobium sp.]MDA9554730.1 acyl-CoA reductase [Pelobium sp.]
MSNFSKEKKVDAFVRLGNFLLEPDEEFKNNIAYAKNKNAWFTDEEINKALEANGQMLNQHDLTQWLQHYPQNNQTAKKIGLILAGNIPLVGFHDILAVLLSGHIALIKCSSQDDILIKAVLNKLIALEPLFATQIQFVEKLENFDAVIATGSNNSSRYFEYYFSKVPHIIRKNRNSIALLNGTETTQDLANLGKDIFDYYGLGCRNVAKLFVPQGYDFTHFFESIQHFEGVINHHKYQNNYDYNKSIYLVNKQHHYDNGFLLVTKSDKLSSPLSAIYYEEYQNIEEAINKIEQQKEDIQVVVTNHQLPADIPTASFGESQHPKLWDYADGVDTMSFLSALS